MPDMGEGMEVDQDCSPSTPQGVSVSGGSAMELSPIPVTDEDYPQLQDVLNQINRPMKKEEYWYLIDSQWFDGFRKYAQTGGPRPGPIDNRRLFNNPDEDVPELKPRLQEHMDYVLVPEEVWALLTDRLGLVHDRHTIKRHVIEQGTYSPYTLVEVYPILLKCTQYVPSDSGIITKNFSRITTLGELEKEIRRLFNIPETAETQLWNQGSVLNPFSDEPTTTTNPPPPPPMPGSTPTESLTVADKSVAIPLPPPPKQAKMNDDHTLHDAGLSSGNVVTLETRNSDGTWPSSRPRMGKISNIKIKTTPGLCGLINLGNTCFMNSALQCLSNVPPLTKYILSGKHMEELNEDNPLGMKGEIALKYAELINAIWSGEYPMVAPREFKATVGRFAPQFSGFNQQDSQELMAFLLDGLHEDLNRIKQKPYIEARSDQDKRPDEEVAAESWSDYKKRNDSIVTDTFHGQLKSTLICPDCQLISVTFDPFCYLSLPIPSRSQQRLNVTFMPLPVLGTTPETRTPDELLPEFKIDRLLIPKSETANEIAQAVAERVNSSGKWPATINANNLIVTNVRDHVFQKIYSPDEEYDVNGLANTTVESGCFIYEVHPDSLTLPCYFREQKYASETYPTLFGCPMILSLRDGTYDAINDAVQDQLRRHTNTYKVVSNDEEMVTSVDEADTNKQSPDTMPPPVPPPMPPATASSTSPTSNSVQVTAASTSAGRESSAASDSSDEGVAELNSSLTNTIKEQYAQIALWLVNSAAKIDICRLEAPPPPNQWGTTHYSFPNITSSCYLAVDVFSRMRSFFKHRYPWYKNPDAVHLNSLDLIYGMDLSSSSTSAKPDSTTSPSSTAGLAASSGSFSTSGGIPLSECIKLYMQQEKLSKDDVWYCPQCKDHKEATKKFDLWSLPKVLIIHMKRFSYSRFWRDKIDTLIEFPIQDLDMSEYLLSANSSKADTEPTSGKFLYDLVGISNHYGGLGGGHYAAYCKNMNTTKWYHFDDSNVTPLLDANLVTKAAYVLFYMRRDS